MSHPNVLCCFMIISQRTHVCGCVWKTVCAQKLCQTACFVCMCVRVFVNACVSLYGLLCINFVVAANFSRRHCSTQFVHTCVCVYGCVSCCCQRQRFCLLHIVPRLLLDVTDVCLICLICVNLILTCEHVSLCVFVCVYPHVVGIHSPWLYMYVCVSITCWLSFCYNLYHLFDYN